MWSYDISTLQARLLDQCIIEIGGDIDLQMESHVRVALAHLVASGSPDIVINITSNGGDITCGLNIYDMIKNYSGHTTGVVINGAHSMALVVLQACDTRRSYANAEFLMHNINRKISIDILNDPDKLDTEIASMNEWQNKIYEVYATRLGCATERIREHSSKAIVLNTAEALDFGLIDEII